MAFEFLRPTRERIKFFLENVGLLIFLSIVFLIYLSLILISPPRLTCPTEFTSFGWIIFLSAELIVLWILSCTLFELARPRQSNPSEVLFRITSILFALIALVLVGGLVASQHGFSFENCSGTNAVASKTTAELLSGARQSPATLKTNSTVLGPGNSLNTREINDGAITGVKESDLCFVTQGFKLAAIEMDPNGQKLTYRGVKSQRVQIAVSCDYSKQDLENIFRESRKEIYLNLCPIQFMQTQHFGCVILLTPWSGYPD